MLLQLERPPWKGPGHVERGVAVLEAAVAERQHDLALGHDIAVEIGDPVITSSLTHLSAPFAFQCRPEILSRDYPHPNPPPRAGEGARRMLATLLPQRGREGPSRAGRAG